MQGMNGAPGWAGMRPFRVADVVRESRQIASFVLEPVDGEPLPAYRAGQYLTVRVRPAGAPRALLRSFSLSAAHDTSRYRLSIKREADGIVTRYLHDDVAPGDVIDVGAPRGVFTLDSAHGREPVVLLSAGIGATPVLAMLHALSIAGSEREVWWIHGARSGAEHAFADEVRRHVAALPCGRSHIRYSRPAPSDVLGRDYDAEGHVTLEVLHDVGVPREARFYLCGPPAWMCDLAGRLLTWGVAPELLLLE
jgi:ferredoxin-NADP reductase